MITYKRLIAKLKEIKKEGYIKTHRAGNTGIMRIGQYPNGQTHDHGTGFRVMPDKLELCFEHREKIM